MCSVLVRLQNLVARSGCQDERGATAVEYALIMIFVALAIVASLTLLGTKLSQLYHVVANQV